MNAKTTLIMGGLLVAILVTIATLKAINAPTDATVAATRAKVIPSLHELEKDNVTQVTFTHDAETIEFARDAQDRWQMKKPIDVLADGSRVDDFIFDMKGLSRRTFGGKNDDKQGVIKPKSPADLAQYQLDSPKIKISVTYKPKAKAGDTKSVTLEVGSPTADKDGLYVKVAGEPFVFVVAKTSLRSLDKKLSDFREHKLVTMSKWDADHVALEWPDRKLAAEQKDGKWRLVAPIDDRGDRAKIEELIGKLVEAKAEKDDDFVDDKMADAAKYGFDQPQLIVELRKKASTLTPSGEKSKDKKKEDDKPQPTQKIIFGKAVEDREDKVFARIDGQNYVLAVSNSVLDDANKQPNDLRSRDLVEMSQFDVDYVSIERAGGGTITIAKKDFDWELFQPKKMTAETGSVSELLKRVGELKIADFMDGGDAKAFELDPPALTVTIYQKGLKSDDKDKDSKDKKGKDKKDEPKDEATDAAPEPKGTPITVLFGKRDEEAKTLYVKRGDEPAVFSVADEGLWDFVSRDYLAYRKKQVLSVNEFGVAKLSIHRDGKTFTVERKKEGEPPAEREIWRMTEPVDAPADAASVSSVLFSVRQLIAKKLVAEGVTELAPYGLDEPRFRVTLTMKADGDKKPDQHVLLVGGKPDGETDSYAKLGDGDLVFLLDERLANDLERELREHSIVKVEPQKVEGVTLTWPDAKLELAYKKAEGKTTKEWSVVGETELKFDATKPNSVMGLLVTLAVDKFAQYDGDFKPEFGFESPALVIEVKTEGDSNPKPVRIGAAAEGDMRYVTTGEKSGVVGLLPESRIKDLIAGPKYFAAAEEKKPESDGSDDSKKDEAKPDEKKPDGDKPADTAAKKSEPKKETDE